MTRCEKTRQYILGKRAAWKLVLRWLNDVCVERLNSGRHVLLENPWSSDALWEPELRPLLARLGIVSGDQCMLGLRSPDGEPIMKPTDFTPISSRLRSVLVCCVRETIGIAGGQSA